MAETYLAECKGGVVGSDRKLPIRGMSTLYSYCNSDLLGGSISTAFSHLNRLSPPIIVIPRRSTDTVLCMYLGDTLVSKENAPSGFPVGTYKGIIIMVIPVWYEPAEDGNSQVVHRNQ